LGVFGEDTNEMTGRERKEDAPVMNGLQHKVRDLSNKKLVYFYRKKKKLLK